MFLSSGGGERSALANLAPLFPPPPQETAGLTSQQEVVQRWSEVPQLTEMERRELAFAEGSTLEELVRRLPSVAASWRKEEDYDPQNDPFWGPYESSATQESLGTPIFATQSQAQFSKSKATLANEAMVEDKKITALEFEAANRIILSSAASSNETCIFPAGAAALASAQGKNVDTAKKTAQSAKDALVAAMEASKLYRPPRIVHEKPLTVVPVATDGSIFFCDVSVSQASSLVRDLAGYMTFPILHGSQMMVLRGKLRTLLMRAVPAQYILNPQTEGGGGDSSSSQAGDEGEADSSAAESGTGERRKKQKQPPTPKKPFMLRDVARGLARTLLILDCISTMRLLLPDLITEDLFHQFANGLFSVATLGPDLEGYSALRDCSGTEGTLDSALLLGLLVDRYKQGLRPPALLLVPAKQRAVSGRFAILFNWLRHTEFFSREEKRRIAIVKHEWRHIGKGHS